MNKPYEDTLSLDRLRLELRWVWDEQQAIIDALREAPEIPSVPALLFLSRASKWPDDYNKGKELQQQYGLEAIPPKTECECGAGVWFRIRQGLLAQMR